MCEHRQIYYLDRDERDFEELEEQEFNFSWILSFVVDCTLTSGIA